MGLRSFGPDRDESEPTTLIAFLNPTLILPSPNSASHNLSDHFVVQYHQTLLSFFSLRSHLLMGFGILHREPWIDCSFFKGLHPIRGNYMEV